MKLIFATQNKNKASEIKAVLPTGIDLLTLSDLGNPIDIPETEQTIEGNAILKARFVHEHYATSCFADDTGLEIEALNNLPGVYSARYAGLEKNDEANMNKVLFELEGVLDRKARFKTVIALIIDNKLTCFEGIIEGKIATEKKGNNGFGYDPIFIPNGYDKTFAEMTLIEKNRLSHRAIATKKMIDYLHQNFDQTNL